MAFLDVSTTRKSGSEQCNKYSLTSSQGPSNNTAFTTPRSKENLAAAMMQLFLLFTALDGTLRRARKSGRSGCSRSSSVLRLVEDPQCATHPTTPTFGLTLKSCPLVSVLWSAWLCGNIEPTRGEFLCR